MNGTHIIIAAKTYAHNAHDSIGQKRKYTGLPYHVHTDEVAGLVTSVGGSTAAIMAAHLHDVLEDVAIVEGSGFNLESIVFNFGSEVGAMVVDLTDIFTKENFPNMNRAARKAAEAARLSNVSSAAQTIKLADLVSNTRDIVQNDAGFAVTYLREKEVILKGLTHGNSQLFKLATELLHLGKKTLQMN